MSKLVGKVAVVTRRIQGIGAAIAKSLAAEGASVVVNYRLEQNRGRQGSSRTSPKPAAKPSPSRATFSKAAARAGHCRRPRSSNTGISIFWSTIRASTSSLLSRALPKSSFHRQFNVNVLGLFTHHAGPR